jgi:hypothetical protein
MTAQAQRTLIDLRPTLVDETEMGERLTGEPAIGGQGLPAA